VCSKVEVVDDAGSVVRDGGNIMDAGFAGNVSFEIVCVWRVSGCVDGR